MKLKNKIKIYIKKQKEPKPVYIVTIIIIILIAVILSNILRKNEKKEQKQFVSICDNAVLRATFVGDVMMGRSVEQIGKREGYESLFENVSYLWKDSDYVSCNLESAVLDTPYNYNESDKEIHLYAKENSVNALKKVGFNIASVANNHIGDYGRKGILNTISVLEKENLDYVGVGENLEEAKKYNIKEINGVKVATIAISDIIPKNFTATDEKAGMLTTDYSEYILIVIDAKENADLVIVNMHWGEEFGKTVSDEQEEIAKNLINAGADIIIGHHQHTVQSIQKYNGGIIFYGLGNFVFDQGWTLTRESMLVNFSLDNEGNEIFEIVPIVINSTKPSVTTSRYHTKRIFRTLTKKLNKSEYTIEDNKLIIKNERNGAI